MKKGFILAALLLAFLWPSPALFLGPSPAWAVNPDEVMSDPALESRAREISKGLRCLVCQNQSIDDSDADLAKDLRVLVRERLGKGDSDADVVEFVVSRYGDFVLLKPPFKAETLVLWLGPLAILGFGLVVVLMFLRRRVTTGAGGPETAGAAPPAPLSDDEKRRLEALMKDGEA